MTYPAHEVRAFVREQFREAQDFAMRRLHELARLRHERRLYFFRIGMNPGVALRLGGTLKVIYQRDQWLKPLPADPTIWCECGRIFHHHHQLNAHKWHCQKKERTA